MVKFRNVPDTFTESIGESEYCGARAMEIKYGSKNLDEFYSIASTENASDASEYAITFTPAYYTTQRTSGWIEGST